MRIRRIKRKIKQHKTKIVVALGAIVFVALIVFLITIVSMPTTKRTYEILETDVLAIDGLQGDQITLKGAKLGDGMEHILKTIGYPDTQSVYPPDLTNMEFGKAFGINGTGVILQFKGGLLTKITFTPTFNELLIGGTKVSYTKDEFLITHGKPEEVKQIQESPTSISVIRLYTYKEGIQFSTKRGIQIALSFINPIE
mgnify:CR=1 FL=1